jgi:hypothetical protein
MDTSLMRRSAHCERQSLLDAFIAFLSSVTAALVR